MNFDRMRFVAERAEIGEEREAVFAVTIPEERGSFKTLLCADLGKRNVTEFNYRISDADARRSPICSLGSSIKSRAVRATRIAAAIRKKRGFATVDLTADDLAKEHLRYMVGGRSSASAVGETALSLRIFGAARLR
jgi:threonine dehydratase